MDCTRILGDHIAAQRAKLNEQDEIIRSLQAQLSDRRGNLCNVLHAQCAEMAAMKEEMAAMKESLKEIRCILRRHFA